MEWKSLDKCVLKFRLVPWCSSRAMQTHLRWETSTRHRSSESHLLVTSSPTRCKLPLPIMQATQAAKSLDLGDSYISECPLWVKSGHFSAQSSCPLYPRKRICDVKLGMSALGH